MQALADMAADQIPFDFEDEAPAASIPLPVTVEVWVWVTPAGDLVAEFPGLAITPPRFPDWASALAGVFHPLNSHVAARVRALTNPR